MIYCIHLYTTIMFDSYRISSKGERVHHINLSYLIVLVLIVLFESRLIESIGLIHAGNILQSLLFCLFRSILSRFERFVSLEKFINYPPFFLLAFIAITYLLVWFDLISINLSLLLILFSFHLFLLLHIIIGCFHFESKFSLKFTIAN